MRARGARTSPSRDLIVVFFCAEDIRVLSQSFYVKVTFCVEHPESFVQSFFVKSTSVRGDVHGKLYSFTVNLAHF